MGVGGSIILNITHMWKKEKRTKNFGSYCWTLHVSVIDIGLKDKGRFI